MSAAHDRLLQEGLVSAAQAVRALGLRASIWTILRWVRRGVSNRRLEAVKVGGRWFTSELAVRRFLAEAPARTTAPPPDSAASPAIRNYLRSIGLGSPGPGQAD